MSFVTNPAQQINSDDSIYHLTDRERKSFDNSWAKPFSEVFPKTDDDPFRVLNCADNGTPNTPVNPSNISVDYYTLCRITCQYVKYKWREKLDLNQRRPKPTDLQSAPFDQAQAFSLIWWDLQESDLGRAELQSTALPAELRSRGVRERIRTADLLGHNQAL